MQFVQFESFPRSGLAGEIAVVSLADLLRAMPYLMTAGLIPPRAIANEVLGRGEFDLGMGGAGKWEPLEFSEADYREVVADLIENGAYGRKLRYEEPPDWVVNLAEWSIWVAERVYSIPADENRRLTLAINQLYERVRQADANGDEATCMDCLVQLTYLTRQHSDFVQRTRRPG